MNMASRCQYCENPGCSQENNIDIRGIMRRVTVGNFYGAKKIANKISLEDKEILKKAESSCILNKNENFPVEIEKIIKYLI